MVEQELEEFSLVINPLILYKCLLKPNINQPTSIHINDGLKLNKAYITTALKCIPP